jgi:hypothetical protein
MKYLTQKELNIIRGKASVCRATGRELLSVFEHYDKIELELDTRDANDYFGTEGWRHAFGLPDAG